MTNSVLTDKDTELAKKLIGSEVYYSDTYSRCRSGVCATGILVTVGEGSYPFKFMLPSSDNCISSYKYIRSKY